MIGLDTGLAALLFSLAILAQKAGYSVALGSFLLGIIVAFFGWLFFGADWTPAERKRLYAIGALFVAVGVDTSILVTAAKELAAEFAPVLWAA